MTNSPCPISDFILGCRSVLWQNANIRNTLTDGRGVHIKWMQPSAALDYLIRPFDAVFVLAQTIFCTNLTLRLET
jgi:hypothetical protein